MVQPYWATILRIFFIGYGEFVFSLMKIAIAVNSKAIFKPNRLLKKSFASFIFIR